MPRDGVTQLFRDRRATAAGPRRLTLRGEGVDFAVPSPDGSQVVARLRPATATRTTALFLLDVGAEKPVREAARRPPGVQCGSVVWAPEGERIFFRANA